MSTWRTIPKENISVEDGDLDILVDADSFGNNYITIPVEEILSVIREEHK